MASPADVRALFEEKLAEGIPDPPGVFDPLDLERVKDDKYLSRIIAHQENNAKAAANMLWDILIWRKTNNINDINENTIRMDYVNEGIFFPRGRDVDGSLLFIIKCKNHIVGQKDFNDIKKIIIYWFERVEREENGKKITMFFDMDGCGLSNMDLDMIRYLINLFKCHYPYFLNYIIIFKMPWVMSAAFKIVKSLLPAQGIEKLRSVNAEGLKKLVHPDQALTSWGGNDNYTFQFVPEKSYESNAKKVTFAEQGDTEHSPGEMLHLVPNDTIIFKAENDEMSGQFTIKNMDESVISFKIRTTSPEKFRVRPSSGILAAGCTQTVIIVVQPGFQLHTVPKDRFLVLSVQIPKVDMSTKELQDVWHKTSGSKVDEYRLKCQFPQKDIPRNGNVVDGRMQEKQDSAPNVLHNLQMNYENINRQVLRLKIFQILTLIMATIAVILAFLIYKSLNDSNKYCEHI